jgi:DNA polymerase III subunit gamma/tau
VVTALYRRYRPETFAELIGQSQVTDPLRTALRTDRVNHAYLFSGPRGCGKTTSARILARCLNCAEGPTDTPCGVCASCVELSRDGSGSLDVVEIDAASHGGVEDARDLRERAIFAPARDRYKIFIVDEAHMVTSGGFNALLKIVEEPPEHVKFIFATTEPDKVIGTIRSRTHHYPFRLVPPAQMLEYTQELCVSEKVEVEPGVLPLVVRAGGGSVRDTLSLLDQLIAGSEGTTVEYERAVALLGYTHGALLSEVVDAIGAHDAAAVFAAVDRVIQTGQDPRRFVEDLLERLRDLIIVAATSDRASAVLRGIPQEELERMSRQASLFGAAELSRSADVVNAALTEMTGATSPRLHLELMVARILVPASDASERGALARVERLERRVGVDDTSPTASVGTSTPAPRVEAPAARVSPIRPTEAPVETPPEEPAVLVSASTVTTPEPTPEIVRPVGPVSLQQLKDSWPEILEVVEKANRNAWLVVFTATAQNLNEDVLTLTFASQNDVDKFKQSTPGGDSVSEVLRSAILDVLGLRVKYIARVEQPGAKVAPAPVSAPAPAAVPAPAVPAPAAVSADGWATAGPPPEDFPEPPEPDVEPAGWAVAAIPGSAGAPASDSAEGEPVEASFGGEKTASSPAGRGAPSVPRSTGPQRYGEAVVREILNASFIEEQPHVPRVIPRGDES